MRITDLSPLIKYDSLDIRGFVLYYIERLRKDIQYKLKLSK